MTIEQMNDIKFYCWQLNITTLGQLSSFKKEHKCVTNDDLLTELCSTYNSPEWLRIHSIA